MYLYSPSGLSWPVLVWTLLYASLRCDCIDICTEFNSLWNISCCTFVMNTVVERDEIFWLWIFQYLRVRYQVKWLALYDDLVQVLPSYGVSWNNSRQRERTCGPWARPLLVNIICVSCDGCVNVWSSVEGGRLEMASEVLIIWTRKI